MPTIDANSTDGWQSGPSGAWDTVHDHVGSGNPDTNDLVNNAAIIAAYYAPPRDFYQLRRVFLDFDTSGVTSTLSSATLDLYVRGTFVDDMDIIILKSGHDPSAATEDWYSTWLTGLGGTISGWSNTDSEVTAYSAECTTTGTGTGYHSCDLNSAALADIKNNDELKVVVMNYDYDYLDTEPSAFFDLGINFSEDIGGNGPRIDYNVAAGYTNSVMGVAGANIAKINGVAAANISKVNGV